MRLVEASTALHLPVGVEVLECKADRIDHRMATRTGRVGPVRRHTFAHRLWLVPPLLLSLQLRARSGAAAAAKRP